MVLTFACVEMSFPHNFSGKILCFGSHPLVIICQNTRKSLEVHAQHNTNSFIRTLENFVILAGQDNGQIFCFAIIRNFCEITP